MLLLGALALGAPALDAAVRATLSQRVESSQRLVTWAFPEVGEGGLIAHIIVPYYHSLALARPPAGLGWVFGTSEELRRYAEVRSPDKLDDIPLSVHVNFHEYSADLGSVHLSGSLTHRRDNRLLRERLNALVEPDQEAVDQAFGDAGARYGPDRRDALVARLQSKGLERLIGRVRVRELTFVLWGEGPAGSRKAECEWRAEIDTITETKARHFLIFEPIGGKLTYFRRN